MTSTRVSSPLVCLIMPLAFLSLTCRPVHTCPPNLHPPKIRIRSDTANKASPQARHPTLPLQIDYSHQGRKVHSSSIRPVWSVVNWEVVWARLVEAMILSWWIGQRGNGWTIYVRALEVKEGLWADSLGRMHHAIRLYKWKPTMGRSHTREQTGCDFVALRGYLLLPSFFCFAKRSPHRSGLVQS